MTEMTPAQRVAAYVQLRDHKAEATKAFDKSLERVVAAMEKLENELLNDLNTSGANSIACDSGTVHRTRQFNVSVNNREAFLEYIKEKNIWEALDVKANKTFVKEHMEEEGEALPGLNVTQFDKIGVRRS